MPGGALGRAKGSPKVRIVETKDSKKRAGNGEKHPKRRK